MECMRTSLCKALLTLSVVFGWMNFVTNAVAGVVPGDFEATIVLRQGEEKLSLPISVSVLVTSPLSASPAFSCRVVVSGSLSGSAPGSFVSTTNEDTGEPGPLSATVMTIKGVPPFTLVYTPPTPATDDDPGFPDSLTVQFAGYEPATAKSAMYLENPDSGQSFTHTDAFAGAFKTSPEAFAAAEEKISALENQVSQVNDSVLAATDEVKTLTDELKSVQTELAAASGALGTLKGRATGYFSALTARDAADAALEKSVTTSQKALSDVILKNVAEIDADSASEMAGLILGDFVLGFVLPAVQMGESEALSQFTSSLSNLLKTTTLENFDLAASEMPFSIPFVFETLASAKAVWTAFSNQTTALTNAVKALNSAELKIETEAGSIDQELLSEIEGAETGVQSLKDSESQAKAIIASKQSEIASMKATLDSLNALKGQYVGSRALTNLAGFGTFQGGLKAATSTAAKPTAVLATIAGVAPDGQKFTYSSKLRVGESEDGGVLSVNTIAGKRPVIFDVGYSVLSGGVGAPENPLVWSGLELEFKVGRALFPSKVVESGREDTGRAMNIFGGPVDPEGVVSNSRTAVSSAVVFFGDATEPGAIDGFGAQINNANVVSKLLVAKKGSTLKLTPSAASAPVFTGTYPFGGGLAKPFSGVFFWVEDESGSGVKGFGSLVTSATASVPVTVYESPVDGEAPQPAAPEVPESPVLLWNGFTSGSISFQLADMPSGLSVTTVKLFKGTKLIATVEVGSDGVARFPVKGLVSGTDYSLRVAREFVSGVYESDPSSTFEISARSLPVYTYQMLLSGDPDQPRNGLPYQGRLTVTTTATGAWSGKLEWIALTQAVDASGTPSSYTFSTDQGDTPVYIPSLVSYTLKGQLSVPNEPSEPGELRSTIAIPTVKGAPGHQLTVSIRDGALDDVKFFGNAPTSAVGLQIQSELTLDPAFGDSGTYFGQTYPSTKGVALAKGKYVTISLDADGVPKDNHSHTVDYAGARTAIYTFQTGTGTSKLTSTGNVSISGEIPFLIFGSISKYSLPYTNNLGRSATASMSILAAAVSLPTLGMNDSDNKYWLQQASLDAVGCELEVSARSKGGYVLREEWANSAQPQADAGWGFVSRNSMAGTKRYSDFLPDEKVQPNTPYNFALILDGTTVLEDTVTFNSAGVATFSDPAHKSLVTLNATLSTGAFKTVAKITEGGLSTMGRSVTATGFAVPGGSLLGWGGIEGGDVGWRLSAQ
jgi:peptidoglycan hydrolase CwlO-like protein